MKTIFSFIKRYKDNVLDENLNFFYGFSSIMIFSALFPISMPIVILMGVLFSLFNLYIIHILLSKTNFNLAQKIMLGTILILKSMFYNLPTYLIHNFFMEPFINEGIIIKFEKINILLHKLINKIKYNIFFNIPRYFELILQTKFFFKW